MRPIFNYKQLAVMWIVGVVVCVHLVVNYGVNRGYRGIFVDWNYTLVYPLLIIGGLLIITFGKSELLKDVTQWLESRKVDQESKRMRRREDVASFKDSEETRRKRDAAFLKTRVKGNAAFRRFWKKGMSDDTLAAMFNMKIQEVRELKKRWKES